MSMSIGRVGLATASGGDGLTWPSPMSWEETDTGVTIAGLVNGLSTADLVFWRDQLIGLASRDETVLPLAVSERPEFDGWYRVVSVAVGAQGGSVGGYNALPWTVSLERIPDWRAPRWESTLTFGPRSSTIAPNSRFWTAIPDSGSDNWEVPSIGTALATDVTTTSEGNLGVLYENAAATTSGSTVSRWTMPSVTDHYVGSCRIEANVGGTWRPIQGMTCPADPDLVRIGNGFTRVTPSGANLTTELYDAGWNSTATAALKNATVAATPVAVSVVENTPQRCILRLICQLATGDVDKLRFTVDLTVVRGHPYVTIGTQHNAVVTARLQVTGASTIVATGAYDATSADGAGNKWLIIAKDTPGATSTTSPAYVQAAAATSAGFALGWELGGAGSYTSEISREFYYTSVSEVARPVVL